MAGAIYKTYFFSLDLLMKNTKQIIGKLQRHLSFLFPSRKPVFILFLGKPLKLYLATTVTVLVLRCNEHPPPLKYLLEDALPDSEQRR